MDVEGFKQRPKIAPPPPPDRPPLREESLTEEELNEILDAYHGATSGPWWVHQESPFKPPIIRAPDRVGDRQFRHIARIGTGHLKKDGPHTPKVYKRLEQSERDAIFILKCNHYIPRLIQDLRNALEELKNRGS